MKILVFGNPLVEKDSIALRIMGKLQEKFSTVEFTEYDTSENIESQGRNLVILDSAEGIDKVVLITDLDCLGQGKIYSMHDFDLPITLKLLKKMNAIESVKIIAVPADFSEEKAVEGASIIISSLLSGNE